MNIFRLAAELFLIYLLYRLVFEFIVPLYQSTKKIKKQFGQMQQKMQEDIDRYANQPNPAPSKKESEDYIDFEEIKTKS
jgi:hypothetical protein